MKKIIVVCMAALMMCSLTACAGNLNHYTKKESEALMEEVIGQDVTYVSTDKYPKEKKVVHLFEDITLGEGACPDVFYFELPIGTVEENKEVIAHMAAAGAQIDELLSLCYDADYALDVDLEGGDYQNYVEYTGMNLRFMYEGIAYDGRVYEKSDMMSFEWSLNEEERWGEEALYEYLESQLTEAVGREPEE